MRTELAIDTFDHMKRNQSDRQYARQTALVVPRNVADVVP
jgi:hypothetical protein